MLRSARARWRPNIALGTLALALFATACTGGDQSNQTSATTSTPTTEVDRAQTLRLALVVNGTAPTADADDELETILTTAVEILGPQHEMNIDLQTVFVETPGQAQGAMSALINNGVSVVITGCDEATIPSVIEAAVGAELLTVTGCVSLPRPDIGEVLDSVGSELFIDLSNLEDNALAIAAHADSQGFTNVAIVRSNLIPDVEHTCTDLTQRFGTDSVIADVTFTELIDAPSEVAAVLSNALPTNDSVDAIVVCALPPAIGDITAALRDAGLDQQVIAPWYADGQAWSEGSGNVSILVPASRHGDDPNNATTTLFEALEESGLSPTAVDVVPADALSVLIDAAEQAGSVGSRRIAQTVHGTADGETGDRPSEAVSGTILLNGPTNSPLLRTYRVLTVENGNVAFDQEVEPVSSLELGGS